MKIRDYTVNDKKKVIELVSGILVEIFNGDPKKFKVLREFDKTKDYVLFLVAEINGNIIGTMALKKIDKETVRLKRMYVRTEYRRKGIAQKLLDQVVTFAKENGYKRMVLSTYSIMENARAFYNRNNFVETEGKDPEQIHVVKEL